MRFPEVPGGHLDEGTAHAWLDGQLSADEAAALEAHVASCAPCAAVVAEARGLVAGATRILGALDEAPTGRAATPVARRPTPARAGGRRRWYVPAAAAATLLVAVTGTLAIRGGEAERASLARPEAASSPAAAPMADRAFEAASPGAASDAAEVAATGAASTRAASPVTSPAASPAPESRVGAGAPPRQQLATTATDARNQTIAGGAANPRAALAKGTVQGAMPGAAADRSGRGIAGRVAGGAAIAAPSPAAPPPAAPAEQTVAARKEEDARMDSVAASAMRLRARAPAATLSDVVVTGATAAREAPGRRDTVAGQRASESGTAAGAFAKSTAAVYLGCWSAASPVDGIRTFLIEPDTSLQSGVLRDRPNGARLGRWLLEPAFGLRLHLDRAREWRAAANSPTELLLLGPETQGITARRVACRD